MLVEWNSEELEVNPFESHFVEGILGTYWWNFHAKKCLGPFSKKELGEFKNAEVIDFDIAVQKRKGANAAQVFRNHRFLRIMGFLKNGKYIHEGRGSNEAA